MLSQSQFERSKRSVRLVDVYQSNEERFENAKRVMRELISGPIYRCLDTLYAHSRSIRFFS